MSQRYVVIGNPVSHSLSPIIQSDFVQQTGVKIQYKKWFTPLDGFENTIKALLAAGVAGANVTVPFKVQAAELANDRSKTVKFAGAANTLKFLGHHDIQAENTDGEGLCQDLADLLAHQDLNLSQVHLLLIGAGGAAQGCILALHAHGLTDLTIINRTVSKAEALAKQAQSIDLNAHGAGLNYTPEHKEDKPIVVVNASSSSLKGQVPEIPSAWLNHAVLALDMMYGVNQTPFLSAAEKAKPGIALADGLGMLVNQAALSFAFWTGVRPNAKATLDKIRQTLDLSLKKA